MADAHNELTLGPTADGKQWKNCLSKTIAHSIGSLQNDDDADCIVKEARKIHQRNTAHGMLPEDNVAATSVWILKDSRKGGKGFPRQMAQWIALGDFLHENCSDWNNSRFGRVLSSPVIPPGIDL